ncbi:hypothetical protein [Yinghuangia seranimata]|uniref:hypothetical protein n=1 Tax=Yinghuangia seranimata TaxID=408067 RepID=UPI00248C7ECF|nr:hypothetical protein [Yinghuangia seranimata]MDI2132561.1 hypothetical protein [Yinghuangia seranimata]
MKRANGTWNPGHGTWWFLLDVPHTKSAAGGQGSVRRDHIRQAGHRNETAARDAMAHVRLLLALADGADRPDEVRAQIANLVRAAIRAKQPLPEIDDLKRRLRSSRPVDRVVTVGGVAVRMAAGEAGHPAGDAAVL